MTQHPTRALLPVVVVFLALLGIMWFGFDKALDYRNHPNRNLAAAGSGPVILESGWGGHFRTPGTINGTSVHFLVDTGASTVAIPGAVAQRLDITRGPRIEVQTASGPAAAYLTRLESVAVGSIVQYNVGAAIIPAMTQDSVLLGMSFLNHVTMVKRDGQLILKQQP